jgi:amino acid adenylation domain-containing protein
MDQALEPATLHRHFVLNARRHPGSPALYVSNVVWSYGELWQVALRISNCLRVARPDACGQCVGVLCGKSVTAYAALLAILESGNIYTPLNPKFPAARLAGMIEDAGVTAIIVEEGCMRVAAELLASWPQQLLVIAVRRNEAENVAVSLGAQHEVVACSLHGSTTPVVPRSPAVPADSYAYLLFTSGSTGRPKGVAVTHRSACALVDAMMSVFPFDASDRCTHFAELTFDFSIGEIFLPWAAGACVYVPTFNELMLATEFVKRHQLTVWSSVPTLADQARSLGLLTPNSLTSLRLSFFCGEALSQRLADCWCAAAPVSRLVNLYGPTEATVFATYYVHDPLVPAPDDVVPLGWPLPGFSVKIVHDEDQQECPGASGELLLAGPQVASGYWRDQASTGRAFVQFDEIPARVWYRTGDLVRPHPERGLLFQGRRDRQVKVRGHRVELQDVETALRRIIADAAVAVVPRRLVNGRCEELVACVSGSCGAEVDILAACRAQLPTHMVPNRLLVFNAFPVNQNGKVDHLQLMKAVDALITD